MKHRRLCQTKNLNNVIVSNGYLIEGWTKHEEVYTIHTLGHWLANRKSEQKSLPLKALFMTSLRVSYLTQITHAR